MTVEWQHRLLAALEVGYFERTSTTSGAHSGSRCHKSSRVPQFSCGSNADHKAPSILIMLLGLLDRLSSTILIKVYDVLDRNEQDLLVMFKPEELSRTPFTISSIPQGAQKAVWKAHEFFREKRYGFLEVAQSRDIFYHVRAPTWNHHQYQDACEVWFIPAKREDFVAVMVF